MNLYAVIPSGNRRQELTDLVNVLVSDGVRVIIVDTGYDTPLEFSAPRVAVLYDVYQPKNISRWWNLGLEMAETLERYAYPNEEFVVAVLNDDIVIPRGFVQALANGIIYHDVSGAFPDIYGMKRDFVLHQVSHWKMSGYAFAMRGSQGFRAREELAWWGGDQDLEWQMLTNGGLVTVGGLPLHHLYPNQSTVGELAEQAGRDRETFRQIWGRYGW